MIIDSHVHLKHGDRQKTEYRPSEVIRTMDGAGIHKSVVFAMATSHRRSTEMTREAIDAYPDRLIPYAYAIPSYEEPVIRELERDLEDRSFRGIKLHIGECSLAEYVTGPVFDLAADHGVPCLIDFGGRLDACEAAVSGHPETTFIVAHFGRYLSDDADLLDRFISLAEQHPNTFLDASGVILGHKIEGAVKRIGAQRILFGTDGPHSGRDDTRYSYAPDTVDFARVAIERIQSLDIPSEDKAAILGENIAKLLHR